MAKSQYDIDREKEIQRQLEEAAELEEYQKQYEENKVFVGYQVELLKIRIQNLRESHDREVSHLREIYGRDTASLETALKLQAKEYDLHLAKLNHEADQLKTMQAKYTLREVFERFVGSTFEEFKRQTENEFKKNREDRNMEAVKIKEDMLNEFKKIRQDEILPIKTWQANQQGKNAILLIVWGAALTLIMFLINYYSKK